MKAKSKILQTFLTVRSDLVPISSDEWSGASGEDGSKGGGEAGGVDGGDHILQMSLLQLHFHHHF